MVVAGREGGRRGWMGRMEGGAGQLRRLGERGENGTRTLRLSHPPSLLTSSCSSTTGPNVIPGPLGLSSSSINSSSTTAPSFCETTCSINAYGEVNIVGSTSLPNTKALYPSFFASAAAAAALAGAAAAAAAPAPPSPLLSTHSQGELSRMPPSLVARCRPAHNTEGLNLLLPPPLLLLPPLPLSRPRNAAWSISRSPDEKTGTGKVSNLPPSSFPTSFLRPKKTAVCPPYFPSPSG